MAKRSKLTVQQRTEAVLALIRREEPAARIARRWGVSEQTLYRYREQFLEGGKAAPTPYIWRNRRPRPPAGSSSPTT